MNGDNLRKLLKGRKKLSILGLDLGTARMGFAIIRADLITKSAKVQRWGLLETPKEMDRADRLQELYNSLTAIIKKHRVKHVIFERVFFSKNVKTAMNISEVAGIVLLLCSQLNLTYTEVTPSEVKRVFTGNGRADKKEIGDRVKELLNLDEMPKPDDVADALAIALVGAKKLIDLLEENDNMEE